MASHRGDVSLYLGLLGLSKNIVEFGRFSFLLILLSSFCPLLLAAFLFGLVKHDAAASSPQQTSSTCFYSC